MKRIRKPLSILLAGVLLISLCSFAVSASAGDVNGDGNVNMKDVLVLRKHIANIGTCNDEAAADMNSDGSLDMKDVLLLRLFIVKGTTAMDPSDLEVDAATISVVDLVNKERAAAGVSAVKFNAQLQKAAQKRVEEINKSFSHTRPDGTSWVTVFDEFNIKRIICAENIAMGFDSPESFMTGTMGMDGQRKNVLNPAYTDIAVGYDPTTHAWVQIFMEASNVPDPSKVDVNAAIQKVVELVNKERKAAGFSALKYNSTLQPVADLRAKEIQQVFSHTRPNGTSCFTAIQEQGIPYSYVGENIAYGYPTPEDVMTAWMNSEGHRANILDPLFTDIAVGYDPTTNAWVQLFLTPPA